MYTIEELNKHKYVWMQGRITKIINKYTNNHTYIYSGGNISINPYNLEVRTWTVSDEFKRYKFGIVTTRDIFKFVNISHGLFYSYVQTREAREFIKELLEYFSMESGL